MIGVVEGDGDGEGEGDGDGCGDGSPVCATKSENRIISHKKAPKAQIILLLLFVTFVPFCGLISSS
ncbi:MAG TPA: hypothetical protein VM656_08025, partial [Pyrinomonadaceae bacterium]|nr:hypothetical protein [Pyrinomonadaceae bacterium]